MVKQRQKTLAQWLMTNSALPRFYRFPNVPVPVLLQVSPITAFTMTSRRAHVDSDVTVGGLDPVGSCRVDNGWVGYFSSAPRGPSDFVEMAS